MSLHYDGARHFELMAIWSCYIISVIVRFSVASLHQKSRGLSPRLFAVRNSPPCAGAAARLTAEPVTVTADARGKVPGGFPVRIFVDAPPYGSVCTDTPHFSRLRVCLSVRYSVLAPLVLTSPVVSTKEGRPEKGVRFFLVEIRGDSPKQARAFRCQRFILRII